MQCAEPVYVTTEVCPVPWDTWAEAHAPTVGPVSYAILMFHSLEFCLPLNIMSVGIGIQSIAYREHYNLNLDFFYKALKRPGKGLSIRFKLYETPESCDVQKKCNCCNT